MQAYAANIGQSFELADLIAVVLARYAEGKTPALAVKSALQLGFSYDVIMLLPGVTPQAYAQGKWLIESGAFAPTATGTAADGACIGPVDLDSPQCRARLAAGLDPYGFPPKQVEIMREQGTYIDPYATVGGVPDHADPLPPE